MSSISPKAARLVRLYGDAREADYMKGSYEPEAAPQIEEYLKRRRKLLHEHIAELEAEIRRRDDLSGDKAMLLLRLSEHMKAGNEYQLRAGLYELFRRSGIPGWSPSMTGRT